MLRRSFLLAPAAAALLGPARGQQPGARRVLALIGDRYHNADYIQVALAKVFDPLKLAIDYTIDTTRLSRSVLKDYQVFLCLRDGMIWPGGYLGPDAYTDYEQNLENRGDFQAPKSQDWLKEEQAAALKDFVNEGKGFYALHNSSHVSLSSKTYRDLMGGAYIGHPPLRPFKVRAVNAGHPITRGIGEFVVNDEQHYVQYDKDARNILLEAENVDGLTYQNLGTKSVAGWALESGRGRVVFTSPGHTIHALWVPEYVKVQQRAMQWLLKEI
jgi:type 1 glutamine amidotransferase